MKPVLLILLSALLLGGCAAAAPAEPEPRTAASPLPTSTAAAAAENTSKEEKSMKLWIGETEVPVRWEENETVEVLRGALPCTVPLSMYGGFEQVGPLGRSFPRADRSITTESGDIVLYSGDQIVLFYGSNSWAYTPLGHMELSRTELEELLGHGDVTITLRED